MLLRQRLDQRKDRSLRRGQRCGSNWSRRAGARTGCGPSERESDGVTHNSTEPDAELHDDSAALENSTMEVNNKTELWPCDGVTHENSTAEADDLREMTTSSSWFGLSSLIAENRECALETRCATVFAR